MQKGIRLIKRLVALFLVLLLSIESFAAVVSDNDGSAFITKAEFDSLKNDFQSQITQYNSSIDSKIDGAIASYLAGIKMAKITGLQNLISNVSDIRWVNNFKVKGTLRTWTSATTKSETSGWFEYPADERRNTRATTLSFLFTYVANNQIGINVNFSHDYTKTAPVQTTDAGNWCDATKGGSPVHYLRCADNEELEFNSSAQSIFHAEQQVNHSIWTTPLVRSGNESSITGPKADWEAIGGYPLSITPGTESVRNMTLVNNHFIELEIEFDRRNRTFEHYVLHLGANAKMTQWPRSWQAYDCVNESQFNAQVRADVNGKCYNGYYNAGVHLVNMTSNNRNTIAGIMRRLMFGRDNNQKTNILRFDNNNLIGGVAQQFLTYSRNVDLPCNIISANIFNEQPWTADSDISWTGSTPVVIGMPLLEKVYYKQIKNSYAIYDGQKLEMGKGIPLVVKSNYAGTLKISFDYAINRLIDSKGTENRLYIDLKNENFYDTTNDDANKFYGGIVNGTEVNKIKDYIVDVNDNKVNITINNFDFNNTVWMRVAPVTEDGGYYATISNLNLEVES